MKRAMCVFSILILLVFSFAYADDSILGNLYINQYVQEDDFMIRGCLKWKMNKVEVYDALSSQKRSGKNVCRDVEDLFNTKNASLDYVRAKAVLGNYEPLMICYISKLWGLYNVTYDFGNKMALSNEAYKDWCGMTDDEFLKEYEKLEATVNYIYGMGERAIDKWNERSTVEDGYYIIKTTWSKNGTIIRLESYKLDNIFHLELEYNAPGSSDYNDILNQDLSVTSMNMFYGF